MPERPGRRGSPGLPASTRNHSQRTTGLAALSPTRHARLRVNGFRRARTGKSLQRPPAATAQDAPATNPLVLLGTTIRCQVTCGFVLFVEPQAQRLNEFSVVIQAGFCKILVGCSVYLQVFAYVDGLNHVLSTLQKRQVHEPVRRWWQERPQEGQEEEQERQKAQEVRQVLTNKCFKSTVFHVRGMLFYPARIQRPTGIEPAHVERWLILGPWARRPVKQFPGLATAVTATCEGRPTAKGMACNSVTQHAGRQSGVSWLAR